MNNIPNNNNNNNNPHSPFDPFEPSPRSAEFQAQLANGEDSDDFYFEAATDLAPMPNTPPPPPPMTPPRESYGSAPAPAAATIAQLPPDSIIGTNKQTRPRPPGQIMPEGLPPPIPPSKRKNKKSKKKKKDKKNKIPRNASNGSAGSVGGGGAGAGAGGKSYNQYSPMTPASPTIDENLPLRRNKINTGELNSAAGEGTTIPQILARMRFMTYALSGLTYAFEAYAMFFHILFLKADKFVLGFYLLFFVALLLLFEIVRGDPVPAANVLYNQMQKGHMNVNIHNGSINMNVNNAAEIVWKMALDQRWARQIRYFLQDNFGMLYSCSGRGLYLCFVGSVALGQEFIIIELIGVGFMILGFWTVFLSFRFPALEKALIMEDLEHEFGSRRGMEQDDASSIHSGSAVTWSSVHSSTRSEEARSLLH